MLVAGVLAALVAAPGCGQTCGTTGAPTYGLTATGSGAMNTSIALTFGAFKSGANNDCTPPTAPKGVVSLTIEGSEMGSNFGQITLCVARPDQLETETQALGSNTPTAAVQMIDFQASDANCSYTLDTTSAPTGTVKAEHECNDGTNKAGFAMEITGTLPLIQRCTSFGTMVPVAATLTGTSAVVPGL